jgi:cysteine synthase
MPETMSLKRRRLIFIFGAELVLTPGSSSRTRPIRKFIA